MRKDEIFHSLSFIIHRSSFTPPLPYTSSPALIEEIYRMARKASSKQGVQHPDLCAGQVLAPAERDSAFSNAKPYRRSCRTQDDPIRFNASDTALRGSAFFQGEAKRQVGSEAKDKGRIYRTHPRLRRHVCVLPSAVRHALRGKPLLQRYRPNQHIQKRVREACRHDSQPLWAVHKRELPSESQMY